MKKIIIGLVVAVMTALSAWLIYYFYKKSKTDPIKYKTEAPFVTNITKKTVATGSVVPEKEIQIKPQVSGIIEALYVEPGDSVRAGQLIAKIRVVQNLSGKNNDMRSINGANNRLKTALANLRNAKVERDRQKALLDQKIISEQDFNRQDLNYNLAKEEADGARENLNLIRQSARQNSGAVSNEIYSTVDGMVLDVPVKVGTSVIERNNFNEGTTIASVADMKNLIFEGKIDESEVGKIKEGMKLNLTIGAIEDKTFNALLEFIAPKGKTEEGAIKFDIKARLVLQAGDYIRAGYSASADIVLGQRDSVLAVKESMVTFKKDSTYVEVETGEQIFEKRLIKTGISDGINIEILEGVTKKEKLKTLEEDKGEEEEKKEESAD